MFWAIILTMGQADHCCALWARVSSPDPADVSCCMHVCVYTRVLYERVSRRGQCVADSGAAAVHRQAMAAQ